MARVEVGAIIVRIIIIVDAADILVALLRVLRLGLLLAVDLHGVLICLQVIATGHTDVLRDYLVRKLRASTHREAARGVLAVVGTDGLVSASVNHALTHVAHGVVTASQLILVLHHHLALVHGVRTITARTVVYVSEATTLLHFRLRAFHLDALLQ